MISNSLVPEGCPVHMKWALSLSVLLRSRPPELKKSGPKKVPQRSRFGNRLLFAKRSHFSLKKGKKNGASSAFRKKGTIFNLF